MRSSTLLLLLGGITSSRAVGTSLKRDTVVTEDSPIVPGAFIVEFNDDQDPDAFYSSVTVSGVDVVERRKAFKSSVFRGASFQVKHTSGRGEAAERTIKSLPSVKNMWPVREIHGPQDEMVWTAGGTPSRESDNGLLRRQSSTNDTFAPHLMTQVDRLHAEGITGAGIRIGIIDSGVDYKHPALGGCFGEGCIVSYGTDYVGDEYDGDNVPMPDNDPYDGCYGHGTHVSGIIAAQPNEFGFTGVAPDVTLGMYRVFSCSATSTNEIIIEAMNQAYEDGSDILSISLGANSGWTEDPMAIVASRIVDAGRPVVFSANNNGDQGLFYASSGANGKGVTATGMVYSSVMPQLLLAAEYNTSDGLSGEQFGWQNGVPSMPGITLPLFSLQNETGGMDDACSELPDNMPDLSEYLVFLPPGRAGCYIFDQAANIVAKGAKYAMYWSSAAAASEMRLPDSGLLGVGTVSADQGAGWAGILAAGSNITVTITDPADSDRLIENTVDDFLGGYLSPYSSWGPTWEMDFYPQVSAPGGMILSTWPVALGGYSVLTGTSMAAPFAAAVTALVAQARGTFDPKVISSVLSTTAKAAPFHNRTVGLDILASTAQQGAGLLQAYDAAYVTTLLNTSSLSFNDTDHFISSAAIRIENTGAEAVTYELGHRPATTFYTFTEGESYPAYFPNPRADEHADMSFSPSSFVLAPGAHQVINVTPSPPAGLGATRIPVYSGWITINGTNNEHLSLPYMGALGSLHRLAVIDPAQVYLTAAEFEMQPAPENHAFTVPYPRLSNGTGVPEYNETYPYPTALIQLNVGSAQVELKLCRVSGPNRTATSGSWSAGSGDRERCLGMVAPLNYPWEYMPRGRVLQPFGGFLEDGTIVPEGSYRLETRALKIFGDRDNEEAWEAYEMVEFGLKYLR